MYTVAPRLIAIIAQDEFLRRRIASILRTSKTVQYAVKIFSSFEDFAESESEQDFTAVVLSADMDNQRQFLSYRRARAGLLPVIFIKPELSLDVDVPDWSKEPLSEVFEYEQVREDVLLISLKYILEVSLVVAEMRTLQQAIELADQTNNRFFQYMSHELAGPLQAAKTLQENTSVLDNVSEIKSNARITALALTHVLDAINNVSEYVRINKKQLSMRKEVFSVVPVMADLVQLFKAHADHKSIALTTEYSGDTEFIYLGDKLRLRQVMVNLIKNAVKFTDQGTIHISLSRVQENLCISVKDSGIGMAPELVAEIMSRHSYTPASGFDGGLGIGLKLSREFLALAGGYLHVQSEPGKGSTFTAILPNECFDRHSPEKISIAG